jgi:hypothetical protein
VDRRAADVVRVENAAARGHHEDAAVEALIANSPAEAAQVVGHQRLQRGVDAGRRGAPVLADRRVELVRQRVRDAGQ